MQKINLSENVQKEPWFLKLNPNGRIPVLLDRARGGFTVFETAAILLYLEQHYDPALLFSFDPVREPNDYSVMLQWMFWAVRVCWSPAGGGLLTSEVGCCSMEVLVRCKDRVCGIASIFWFTFK